jgi:hypothetical protein
MFTPAALEVFFNRHYAAFEPVQITKSPFKDRAIVEVRKRNIETMTVIAGPTGAGKSTFMERLRSDPALRRSLSIPEEITAVINSGAIGQLPNGPIRHLVWHYDMLRPFDRALRTHARDPLYSLFRTAREINFLTVMTPRDRLQQQLKQNELHKNPESARPRKLYSLYAAPDFLKAWYAAWFAHCAGYPSMAQHLIVENRGDYRYFPAEQWPAIFDEHLRLG